MPRRLAPLLILLHLCLLHATTPTAPNTHTPVKALAVPHPDVFISLKEWKRQRIQDLESRVRKADEKRSSPRRTRSAICKPRARLLAFLSRVDVCPPLNTPPPTIAPNASSDDPYSVSGKHAYGDVNPSAVFTPTAVPKEVQPASEPAVSPVVLERATDTHLPEKVTTDSVQGGVETAQDELPVIPIEPDELTGRNEDPSGMGSRLYIPNMLPKVLPNVIPKVGEFVKSIKEVSLAYATPGDTPADSIDRSVKTSGSTTENTSTTGNATSQDTESNTSQNAERLASNSDLKGSSKPASGPNGRDGVFADEQMLDAIVKHSTDSGVKEKPFNFASVDAGARVLAVSNDVVGAKNVIQDSDDKYLLAPCAGSGIAGSRWVDLELSEEVILESIETGNFEYYSSSPQKIAVLGASTYPPKKWNVLGIFDFANVKTLQKFQIEKRGVTRYLRVIFAGKQGTEYYCPISTVRAFGKNLIADWKDVFEKPATQRKAVGENGAGSKSRMEKESDKSRTENTRGTRKVEGKPPENAEICSGEHCKAATDTSKASESPMAIPRETSQEDKREAQGNQDSVVRSNETQDTGKNVANAQDQKDSTDNEEMSSGDDALESDVESEMKDSEDVGDEVSDETVSEEDKSDANRASYDDGDHVSEDDQVVIDALRSDTLTPVDGDDNIFRKVTRMLRLLELNQTLTNQYIDTQLSKFAAALSDTHSKSRNASDRVDAMQRQLEVVVARLESRVEELMRGSLRRDVLLCVLLVCVAFLVGTHWILWAAVRGVRLHEESGVRRSSLYSDAERVDRMLQADDITQTSVTRVDCISSEGPSPAGKKKKRKGKKPFSGEGMNGGYFSASKVPRANGLGSGTDGRSISSFELPSGNGRRRFGSFGGTFDVLGRNVDQ